MLSFRELLDYAEKLYDNAKDLGDGNRAVPFVIGSILISWMSIESFTKDVY
jgi:hypothetical protein